MKIKVGLVGVTGYAGQELLKILLRHLGTSVLYLGSRQVKQPRPVGDLLPAFRDVPNLTVQPFRKAGALKNCECVFLALPQGVAMTLAPKLLRNKRVKVIDLSGDFRLRSARQFAHAYQMQHTHPALLKEAVYGLPECFRHEIRSARLVANPGCYPTAALLGCAPLARAGLLKKEGLIVDAKSGVTGAGRGIKEELLFSEVNEDLRAYRVNAHQHIPEMEQELRQFAVHPVELTFVPHLIPMNRGLYATIYAPLVRSVTETKIRSIFAKAYQGEPFIRLLPEGSWPQTKSVAGTNRCEIALRLDQRKKMCILLVAIDNLGKGAAGQAVQNMNVMFGFKETEGLIP